MKGQFIYKITNLTNGKFYVGSTTNTRERFRTHRKRLRNNKHHCHHLQAAWNKHGENKFIFHIVETVPDGQNLQDIEDIWLTQHVGKGYCYNHGLRSGAPWRGVAKEKHPNFGKPVSEEQRQAISNTLKQFYAKDITNHPRFGKKHSEETRVKISAKVQAALDVGKGGKFIPSEETRKKMSEALKGNQCAKGYKRTDAEKEAIRQRTLGNKNWLGKKHSEEAKAKMSRAVIAVSPEGVETKYVSITALRQALQITPPTVDRALKSGKPLAKGARQGWKFMYCVDT